MKRLLPLVIALPVHAITFDDAVDYIDETFEISATTDAQGDYYFTLNASHKIDDTWRVFGEYDTNHNHELGVGYSFFASVLYNELTLSAKSTQFSTYKPFVGLFSATLIGESIVYTNFEVGYGRYDKEAENEFGGKHKFKHEEIDFNKSVGIMRDVADWLTISYAFNHDKTWSEGYYDGPIVKPKWRSNSALVYHEVSASFDIKGFKPSITYTVMEGYDNTIEFGFSFDF